MTTEAYQDLVESLGLCPCLTCEGTEKRNQRLQEANRCEKCEGRGQTSGPEGEILTCSSCLGGG